MTDLSQGVMALDYLRAILDEALPAPCLRSRFVDWCAQRGDPVEILGLLEAEVVVVKHEAIVVSYRPNASFQDRLAAILLCFEPLDKNELRNVFRAVFPAAVFQEHSLDPFLMGLTLNASRIVRLPNEKYTVLDAPGAEATDDEDEQDEDADEEAERDTLLRTGLLALGLNPHPVNEGYAWGIVWENGIKWIPYDQTMDEEGSNEEELDEDPGMISLGSILLSSLSLSPRTFRLLTRHRIFTVEDVFQRSADLLNSSKDFRPGHWLDLISNLRAIVPALHPAHRRLDALEALSGHRDDRGTISEVLETTSEIDTGVLLEGDLDETDLVRAIDQLPDGGTLRLGLTTIRLKESITIFKALTIQGQGAEHSQITYQGLEESVVELSGDGPWTLLDLTISLAAPVEPLPDKHWNCSLSVESGRIEILRCRFQGAEGAGLLICGTTEGRVAYCEAEGNGWGIQVGGESGVTVEANRLHDNGDDGLLVDDRAHCLVRNNDFFENTGCGVWISDQSKPTLEDNRCQENGKSGIRFSCDSSGLAIRNNCQDNGLDGILVEDQAAPALELNRCTQNGENGIHLSGNAGGSAHKNECHNNRAHGLLVSDDSKLSLIDNRCCENLLCGICFADDSECSALRNECRENEFYGISVQDRAQAILENNLCSNNTLSGMCFTDQAAVSAIRNECRENIIDGISVIDEADPNLEGNLCHKNCFQGISFEGKSTGIAVRNECRENRLNGILAIEDSLPVLDSNRCLGNGMHGISLASNEVAIARDNFCAKNDSRGVAPLESDIFILQRNHSESNWLEDISTLSLGKKAKQPFRDHLYDPFVEALRVYGSPKWFNSFLDVLKEMLQIFKLTSEDSRLSLCLNEDGELHVTIGQRRVLTPISTREVHLILPIGFDSAAWGGTLQHDFVRGKAVDARCFSIPLKPDVGLPENINVPWLSAISQELKRVKTCGDKKYHSPVFFEAAVKQDFRRMVLLDAFG